jgi:hypothetical protein
MALDDFAVKKPRRSRKLRERKDDRWGAKFRRVPPICAGYVWDPKNSVWMLLGFRRWSGRMRPKNVRALRRKFAVPHPAICRFMDLFVAAAVGPGDAPDRQRANRDSPLENLPAPRVKPPAESRRIDQRSIRVSRKTQFIAIRTAMVKTEPYEHPLYLGPLTQTTLFAAQEEAAMQFPLGVVEVRELSQLSKSMRRRIRNGSVGPGVGRLKFKKPEEPADADMSEVPASDPGTGAEGEVEVQQPHSDVFEDAAATTTLDRGEPKP